MNNERDKGKARKRVNEDDKAKKEKNLFVCPCAGQERFDSNSAKKNRKKKCPVGNTLSSSSRKKHMIDFHGVSTNSPSSQFTNYNRTSPESQSTANW